MAENIISKIKIQNTEYDLKVVTDAILNSTSTNPIENQAVAVAIDNLLDAIDSLTKQDVGVFVQDSEPTSAAIGDIWIDTSISDLYSVEGVSF